MLAVNKEEQATLEQMIAEGEKNAKSGNRKMDQVINCKGSLSLAQFTELAERIRNFHCFRNHSYGDDNEQKGVKVKGVKYVRPFSVSFNADTRDWKIFNLILCGWETTMFVGSTGEEHKNHLPMYEAIMQYLYAKSEKGAEEFKHTALSYRKVLEQEGIETVYNTRRKELYHKYQSEHAMDFFDEMKAVHTDFIDGEPIICGIEVGEELNGYMAIHETNGNVVLMAIDGEPLFKGNIKELSQFMNVLDMVGLSAGY
jgi:hypothetical protein